MNMYPPLPSDEKVNNNGTSAEGRLAADEWNTLVQAVADIIDYINGNNISDREHYVEITDIYSV